MNKELDYEFTKHTFIQNIDDSYTLNLAISFLEDTKSLMEDNLMLSIQNTNLKQALNEIRQYCKRFMPDDEEWQHDILQIIDKTLGDEK